MVMVPIPRAVISRPTYRNPVPWMPKSMRDMYTPTTKVGGYNLIKWPNSDHIRDRGSTVIRCRHDQYIMARKIEETKTGYESTYRCPIGHEFIKTDRGNFIANIL